MSARAAVGTLPTTTSAEAARIANRAAWYRRAGEKGRQEADTEGREEDLRIQGRRQGHGVRAVRAEWVRQGEEIAPHHRAARPGRQPAAVHAHPRADRTGREARVHR